MIGIVAEFGVKCVHLILFLCWCSIGLELSKNIYVYTIYRLKRRINTKFEKFTVRVSDIVLSSFKEN